MANYSTQQNNDTQMTDYQKGRAVYDMLVTASMYGMHLRFILANPEVREHAVRLIKCIANETQPDHPLNAEWRKIWDELKGK